MANKPLVSPGDMLDIIFANRNRDYGAYQLRRDYPNYLARALGLGLLLIASFLVLPRLLRAIAPVASAGTPDAIVFEPGPPPEIAPTPPPPPPVETPPPPVRTTLRFVPPVVQQDDRAPDDTPPPAQEDLAQKEGDIGRKDQTGTPDAPPTDLPEGPGLGGGVIETPVREEPDVIFDGFGLQKPPSFPGGEQELMKYLAKNIQYPALAREAGIQGTVALSFVIGKDGSIVDVVVLREVGGGCTKEAVRVVKSMPRWSPGEANGYPVKARFTLPVRFRLL